MDALASHAGRERRLEILKDPHAGAFAVMGCALYLLVTFGLWTEYAFAPRTAGVLALGFLLSRSLSGLSVLAFPRARREGLAVAFADSSDAAVQAVLLLWVFACAFGMLRLDLAAGGACLAAAVAVFLYYKWSVCRSFGGVTGDLAGYFLQLCELGMLAAVVSLGVIK